MEEGIGEEEIVSIIKEPDRPPKTETFLSLILSACKIFEEEDQVIELQVKRILIVGDLHGDLISATRAVRIAEREGAEAILFLGDYVDRGPKQVEVLSFLLGQKILKPERFLLLRGNHESPLTIPYYGFLNQLRSYYGLGIYKHVEKLFSLMPYAALVNGSILALHGGLAKGLSNLNQVRELPKGDIEPRNPIAFQILWNDPDEAIGWFGPNIRGPGIYTFGKKALTKFLEENNLIKLFRAHQFFPEGIKIMFDGLLISIFSCSFYGGTSTAIFLKEGKIRPIRLV